MKGRNLSIKNQLGFTLIEIIAVLVLLGILAAVAVPKYMDLTTEAKNKAISAAVAEMNSRETMVWGKIKLSNAGWTADANVTGHADYSKDLGTDYTWSGNDITFKGTTVTLTRTASTATSPARWTQP